MSIATGFPSGFTSTWSGPSSPCTTTNSERGVTYTNIVTKTDIVVTPYTNQFLTAGPGATVHNILLQNLCALDLTGHLGSPYDPNVHQLVLNALDPAHSKPVRCALMPIPV